MVGTMAKACPNCGFTSDPETGDVFDVTFPCPRCGHGGARVAARLIQIDRSAIERVLGGFQDWATAQSREYGSAAPAGKSGTDGYTDLLMLQTPWGEGRNILVAFLPGRGFGGGFGHLGQDPLVKVFFDERYHWGSLSEPAVLRRIGTLLQHEVTHALDRLEGATQEAQAGQPSALEELGVDPARYFNDPNEVRAYMRSVYEEIAPQVSTQMQGPLAQKWGLGKVITVALRSSPAWKMAEPHLTAANQNRILKGLVTEFIDQLEASPAATRVAARFIRTAGYFAVGDLVWVGKYKNKLAIITAFGEDAKGNPTITISPIPKGRKQDKTFGLFKVWKVRPEQIAELKAKGKLASRLLCATKFAYHGTRKSVLPHIQRNGLAPSHASSYTDNYSEYDEEGDHLFFSDDPDYVRGSYGDTTLRFPWPNDTKPDKNVYGRLLPHQFVTKEKIPPGLIEIEVEGTWEPLESYGQSKLAVSTDQDDEDWEWR